MKLIKPQNPNPSIKLDYISTVFASIAYFVCIMIISYADYLINEEFSLKAIVVGIALLLACILNAIIILDAFPPFKSLKKLESLEYTTHNKNEGFEQRDLLLEFFYSNPSRTLRFIIYGITAAMMLCFIIISINCIRTDDYLRYAQMVAIARKVIDFETAIAFAMTFYSMHMKYKAYKKFVSK